MENPKVSIIIPTYNRAHMIERAVASILAQTYENLEIVIVDDASQDNTVEVASSINDPRIKVFTKERNEGASATRNVGIAHASGEYLAFLDSDDEFTADKIEKMVRLFETLTPKPVLVFSNYWEIGDNKELHIDPHVESQFIFIGTKFPASIVCEPPSSWMVEKKSIMQDQLFDDQLWTMEDLDYFARLVRKHAAYYLNEPLLIKHVHTCKKGSVPIKHAKKTGERILAKWLPEMAKDKKYLADLYCMLGKDLTTAHEKKDARKYLLKALEIHPLNTRTLWKLIKTYFV